MYSPPSLLSQVSVEMWNYWQPQVIEFVCLGILKCRRTLYQQLYIARVGHQVQSLSRRAGKCPTRILNGYFGSRLAAVLLHIPSNLKAEKALADVTWLTPKACHTATGPAIGPACYQRQLLPAAWIRRRCRFHLKRNPQLLEEQTQVIPKT